MSDEHQECQDANPLEGKYANYFKIGYNAFEFILDFGQFYSEGKEPKMHTRIILSPVYAKALSEMLRESVDGYEYSFGVIPTDQ